MKKRIFSIAMTLALIMSLSMAALAAEPSPAEMDISGQGYIADDTEPTQVLIDVTAPASFLWYADNSTENTLNSNYDIVSGQYQIINNSETVNLQVEILDYAQAASGSATVAEADVTLNLAGDFEGYWDDIFNNSAPAVSVCPDLLASINGETGGVGNSTWILEFDGTYNQPSLPSTPQLTDYILSLEFTAASIS